MKISNRHVVTLTLIVSIVLGFAGPIAAFAAGPAAVNLGSAGNFTILAKTGISTTGPTSIVGNLGLSPAAASYITGFGLIMDISNTFSTSALVSGKIYAADYTAPTPTTMTAAISDMQTAYTDAAGRTNPTETEMGAGSIGGTTLVPGLYKWGTDVTIPTDMTLSGGANDVWIFQIAGNLIMSSATHIILSGGAQAANVFWQVAGQTTIGTTAVFNGNILDQTTIVLNTGATLNGRALAQAAVTLDSNTVTTAAAYAPPIIIPAFPTPIYTPAPAPSTSNNPALMQTQTPPPPAPSNPNAALQAQINGLLGTLQSLQVQASQQGSQIRMIAFNLRRGSSGNNVTILQQFLISQNKGSAAQALARAGATAYFGALTSAALTEFQANAGISPASGNFGPLTRAYINANY
jgi:hypothetical protein